MTGSFRWWAGCLERSSGARSLKYQLLAIIDHVQFRLVEFDIPDEVYVAVTSSTERIGFALQFNPGNFASPVAFLFTAAADKRLLVDNLPVRKPVEVEILLLS